MTFGQNHYVPVLKMKRGEKRALELLAPAVVAHVTPLLEVVENKSGKSTADHLATCFAGLGRAMGRGGRYFLDTREISGVGSTGATQAFEMAMNLGLPFTPVTGILRTVDVDPAIAVATNGLALRVTRQEFERGVIPDHLPAFVADHDLSPESVDLLVDLGPVEEMIPEGICRLSMRILDELPELVRWRTLTLIGSAFPLSMKNVNRHSYAFADRSEWLSWRDVLYSRRAQLARLPTYGDCGIQHPRGVEGFDPRYMPMSGSIRYALLDQWLLIKGESNVNTPLIDQFPRLAARLTAGDLSAHFAGEPHCAGCQSIVRAANGAANLGSAEVWRRIGSVHHITRTSDQIQRLAWP